MCAGQDGAASPPSVGPAGAGWRAGALAPLLYRRLNKSR
jgi:hypothetical protein